MEGHVHESERLLGSEVSSEGGSPGLVHRPTRYLGQPASNEHTQAHPLVALSRPPSSEQERRRSTLPARGSLASFSTRSVESFLLNHTVSEEEERELIVQASYLVKDAVHGRNVYHRIDVATLTTYYDAFYHPAVTRTVNVLVFLNMAVAFFEPPTPSSVPLWAVLFMEQLCLLAFSANMWAKWRLFGRYFHQRWNMALLFVLAASQADLLVSMATAQTTFRVRRYLRPLLLLQQSTWLRQMLKNVARTATRGMAMCTVLAACAGTYALVSMVIFDGTAEGDLHFSNGLNATMTTLVLLTTANHPDAMLPAVSANKAWALWFAAFNAMATFMFLNLVTAMVYYHFQAYTRSSLQNTRFRRHVGLRGAFELLNLIPPVTRDRVHVDSVQEVLTLVPTMAPYRPFVDQWLAAQPTLTFDAFYALFNVTLCRAEPMEEMGPRPPSKRVGQVAGTLVGLRVYKALLVLCSVFFSAAGCLSILHHHRNPLGIHTAFAATSLAAALAYATDTVLCVLAVGIYVHVHARPWHVFDVVHAAVLLLLRLACCFTTAQGPWQVLGLVLVVSGLRALRTIAGFRQQMGLLGGILHRLCAGRAVAVVLVLLGAFYIFAMAGMDCFQGAISRDKAVLADSDYGRGSYYGLDFNSMGGALCTLWALLLVNNWHVFMEAHVLVCGQWARVFFVLWYAVGVLVLLNLVVAFVIDSFVSKYDAARAKSTRKNMQPSPLIFNGTAPPNEAGQQRLVAEDDIVALFEDTTLMAPTEDTVLGLLRLHGELWPRIRPVVGHYDHSQAQWLARETAGLGQPMAEETLSVQMDGPDLYS